MAEKTLAELIVDSLERRMYRREKRRRRLEDRLVGCRGNGQAPLEGLTSAYEEACHRFDEARLAYNSAVELWNGEVSR